MAQQWETCRVSSSRFHSNAKGWDERVGVDFYTPSGVITRWPAFNSFEGMIGSLSAAGWELVTVQHANEALQATGGTNSLLGWIYYEHPDKQWKFAFSACRVVAYLKRPMESGRRIDDIFPSE